MEEEYSNKDSRSQFRRCFENITVEPVMFFYMFAFMLTSVIEQAFFIDRACRTNLNFNDTICSNYEKQDESIKSAVQTVVANFLLWNGIVSYIVPFVLALFLGAWSDKRGRKLPLLLGLLGKLFYSIMIVVISYQPHLPVESILYLASFPSAITGADVAIFASAYSYIADITTSEKRTLRVTILDVVYLFTMPTGVALGKYLFNSVVNKSYGIMFAINASCLIIAIIYGLLRLNWTTKPTQVDVCQAAKEADRSCCCWTIFDFLDWRHVKLSFEAIVRKRLGLRRLYLGLFFISIALYSFQRDEKKYTFLYTQYKFEWDYNQYSDYRTFQNSAYVIGTLIGYPLLSNFFCLRDETIAMFGCTFHIIARTIFATAQAPWVFYIGGGIVSLGPVVSPIIRSLVTKMVPLSERGKVLAVLTSCDTALPLITSPSYSKLYLSTINFFPQSIFVLTIASQAVLFCILLFIRCTLGKEKIDVPEQDEITLPTPKDNQQE